MPTVSSITISGAHTDGYVSYLYHINTMLNTHEPSNSRWCGMAGAGKCPNGHVNHGPVDAGCLWQAPSPYRVLKQVDMRRILVTHSHARTMHNTSNHSTTSWFGMVGAGKCLKRACKARASRCGLHMASSIAPLHFKQVDMRHILLTHSHSSTVCTILNNFQMPAGLGWLEPANAQTSV